MRKRLSNFFAGVRRNLVFRTHETVAGRKTFRYTRELERSQWMSPAGIRNLQNCKLVRLFQHAQQNVPYYRKMFQEAEITRIGDPVDQLKYLPLLCKQQIRQA